MGLLPKQAVVIVAVGIFCVGIAHAEIMTKVGGVRSLLISALTAPDGTASGTVEGREADYIHAKTGATDPVKAEVSTVKRFANEPGCGRLALKLAQPNMPTKDGTPPAEGVDIGAPKTGRAST